MKIYLSPSSQEKNVGVGNYGTEEKRMNELCDILEKKLSVYEYTLYRNERDMTVQEMAKDSNHKGAQLHIALHSNASNGKTQGCEIFCHKFGGTGERLARSIYKYLEPITPSTDRGIKQGLDYYGAGKHIYELAYTGCPAVLIEVAFHDNPVDAEWITINMELIALSIVKGINDITGIKTLPPKSIESIDNKNYKELYESLLADIRKLMKLYGVS